MQRAPCSSMLHACAATMGSKFPCCSILPFFGRNAVAVSLVPHAGTPAEPGHLFGCLLQVARGAKLQAVCPPHSLPPGNVGNPLTLSLPAGC